MFNHSRHHRRGGSTGFALSLLAGFCTLGVTAAFIGPRIIIAYDGEADILVAADPSHQNTIEIFAGILARSRAVLALHDRGETPYEEIVLWIEDRDRPGKIDPHEVVVISHSKVLQTLTYFAVDKIEGSQPLSLDELKTTRFCDQRRTDPGVTVRVIGAGISDLDLSQEGIIQGGRALLRISFTWASELTDSPDEAAVLVDVVMQTTNGQE